MRIRFRIVATVGCALLAVAAVVIFALMWAVQYRPQFYSDAMAVDPVAQRQASDQMLQQVSGVWNNAHSGDRWEVLFTAEQINGWLAVDLVENHPDALPENLSDPRVLIEEDRITMACRLQQDGAESVVSLSIEPYLAEPDVLGLRICRARAGLLPWPLRTITDRVSEAAKQAELPVRWLQADGDPVVLISIPAMHDEEGDRLGHIDTLQVRRGEIYLAGSSVP